MPEPSDPDLREVVELLQAMPADDAPDPAPELRDRVLGAVQAAAAEPPDELATRRDQRRSARGAAPAATAPRRRWLAAVACVALLAAGTAVGVGLTRAGGPPGELELTGELRGAGTSATASIAVRRLGYGRSIALESTTLPIIPEGEYYELWFVGPGDRPRRPNRISGGTFHPDADGVSRVTLKAAVDPSQYPRVVISREPGDGDPAPSGEDVLRLDR